MSIRSFVHRSICLRYASSSSSNKNLAGVTKKDAHEKDIQADTLEDEPLPLLQRPLGVPERPTTVVRTWADKRNDLMNQDIRLAQRKHLLVNLLSHITFFADRHNREGSRKPRKATSLISTLPGNMAEKRGLHRPS